MAKVFDACRAVDHSAPVIDGKAVECTSGGAFSVSGEPLTDIQMREAVADTLEGHWRGAAGQRKSGGAFPVIDAGAVNKGVMDALEAEDE